MKPAPQPAEVAVPGPRAAPRQAASHDEAREDAIRRTAYLLYEARGRIPGHELEDWLQAEMLVTLQEAADAAAKASPPPKAAQPRDMVEATDGPKAVKVAKSPAKSPAKAPEKAPAKAPAQAPAKKVPKAAAKRAPTRSRTPDTETP